MSSAVARSSEVELPHMADLSSPPPSQKSSCFDRIGRALSNCWNRSSSPLKEHLLDDPKPSLWDRVQSTPLYQAVSSKTASTVGTVLGLGTVAYTSYRLVKNPEDILIQSAAAASACFSTFCLQGFATKFANEEGHSERCKKFIKAVTYTWLLSFYEKIYIIGGIRFMWPNIALMLSAACVGVSMRLRLQWYLDGMREARAKVLLPEELKGSLAEQVGTLFARHLDLLIPTLLGTAIAPCGIKDLDLDKRTYGYHFLLSIGGIIIATAAAGRAFERTAAFFRGKYPDSSTVKWTRRVLSVVFDSAGMGSASGWCENAPTNRTVLLAAVLFGLAMGCNLERQLRLFNEKERDLEPEGTTTRKDLRDAAIRVTGFSALGGFFIWLPNNVVLSDMDYTGAAIISSVFFYYIAKFSEHKRNPFCNTVRLASSRLQLQLSGIYDLFVKLALSAVLTGNAKHARSGGYYFDYTMAGAIALGAFYGSSHWERVKFLRDPPENNTRFVRVAKTLDRGNLFHAIIIAILSKELLGKSEHEHT